MRSSRYPPRRLAGTVTISDASIFAATVAADDMSVDVSPLAVGTATLTYTNTAETPPIVATLDVQVVDPEATAVTFDLSTVTFTPKPASAPTPPAAPPNP